MTAPLPESPASVIRRTAALMDERAAAVPTGPWEHVRSEPTTVRGPAYHTVHHPPQPPYTVGGSVCDTGPYDRGSAIAAHVASWDPLAAKAVAQLLFAIANEMDGPVRRREAVAKTYVQRDGTTTVGAIPVSNVPAWTAAYEAALTYLGETGGAP